MSTSNIKSPIVPRVGYVEDWTKPQLQNISIENVLKCELEKENILLVSTEVIIDTIDVVYYKWLQKIFLPYSRRQLKLRQKKRLETSKFEKESVEAKLKRLRRYNNRVFKKHQKGYVLRLKKSYVDSQSYILPRVSYYHILLGLGNYGTHIKNLNLINVYEKAKLMCVSHIDVVNFAFSTPQLRFWSSFKFYLDTMAVCDFIRLQLMQLASLVSLIKIAFIRNSKRGQQRAFLTYIQKVPRFLNSYILKRNNNGVKRIDFNWIVVVCGKFVVTGRTQKFVIQSKKLPLHTLLNIYDFAESFVNTKAGTFSIRVWRYKL